MTRSPKTSGHQPNEAQPGSVQGEGDYQSAKTYGKAVRSFVQSGKAEDAARHATVASKGEQEELLKAERIGLSHSKGEDPASPLSPVRQPGHGEHGTPGHHDKGTQ